jgi:hypothetical protein
MEGIRVPDVPKVQAVRGRRRGAPSPIPALQHLTRPGWRRLASSDLDQQSRDIPHHVVQERIRGGLNHHPIALPFHSELLNAPDGRIRLTFRRPEGAEVEMAAKVDRSLGHAYVIERFVDEGGALFRKSGARGPVQDEISVSARLGRLAGVEVEGHWARPHKADVPRELRIGSHDPTAHGSGYVGVEVGNLPACVNAGVRSARTDDLNGFSRHTTQGSLNEALNGR